MHSPIRRRTGVLACVAAVLFTAAMSMSPVSQKATADTSGMFTAGTKLSVSRRIPVTVATPGC